MAIYTRPVNFVGTGLYSGLRKITKGIRVVDNRSSLEDSIYTASLYVSEDKLIARAEFSYKGGVEVKFNMNSLESAINQLRRKWEFEEKKGENGTRYIFKQLDYMLVINERGVILERETTIPYDHDTLYEFAGYARHLFDILIGQVVPTSIVGGTVKPIIVEVGTSEELKLAESEKREPDEEYLRLMNELKGVHKPSET